MKACVLSDWKKLEIKEIPVPELEEEQVLIEMIYGGVCGSDVTVTNHKHLTATVPRILCHELLGRVKEIRSSRNLPFKEGDKVCVFPLVYCGNCEPCLTGHTSACSQLKIMGVHIDGGFAEYCAVPVESVIPVPKGIPDEIAVLTEPLSVAFHANALAGTKPGDRVLVTGAGPIGLLCAMTAKYFGAAEVYVSEIKPERLDLAKSLGLNTVNPMEQDILAYSRKVTGSKGFDVVLEVTGAQAAYDIMVPVCRECGSIVTVAIPSQPRSYQTNMFILKEIRLQGIRCCPKNEFARTVTMVQAMCADLKRYPLEKMIDSVYSLEDCARGIYRQESGLNNGKILIRIGSC